MGGAAVVVGRRKRAGVASGTRQRGTEEGSGGQRVGLTAVAVRHHEVK